MMGEKRWWCFWKNKVYDHVVLESEARSWLKNVTGSHSQSRFIIPENAFNLTVYKAFVQLQRKDTEYPSWITLPKSVWNDLKKKGERG